MPPLPQLEAAPASFGLAPSTPSGIPARALQPQQQGPEFPSSPMGGPQLGCGTSRAPWRAVPYTCPSPLPTERVSPPDFIPPPLGTTAHGWRPAILLPLLLTPPTVCSHSASLGNCTSAPPTATVPPSTAPPSPAWNTTPASSRTPSGTAPNDPHSTKGPAVLVKCHPSPR